MKPGGGMVTQEEYEQIMQQQHQTQQDDVATQPTMPAPPRQTMRQQLDPNRQTKKIGEGKMTLKKFFGA
jgi:FtsZ-interacting cell division protein YlmF